jgi:hypothetical protein
MTGAAILQPVVALLAWTMVMWLWMYAVRIPAIRRLPQTGQPGEDVGWTGRKLDDVLPPKVQWKAHNYNHLHEAPTLFYAVALVLAIIGQGDGLNALLAWAYVGLRVVHSLWQATVNRVIVRFALFAVSQLALLALVVHAVIAVFAWH